MEKLEQKLNTDAEPLEDPKFKEKWEHSLFSDVDWLETMTEAIDMAEKDNEHPKDELEKVLAKIPRTPKVTAPEFRLLERAIRQEQHPEIQESAFRIILDLAAVAKLGDHSLLDTLVKIARRNLDPAIQTVEENLPAKKYARLFLFDAAKEDKFKERALPILKNYILDSLEKKDIDSVDIEMLDWLCLTGALLPKECHQALNSYLSENPDNYEIVVACIRAKTKEIRDAGLDLLVSSLVRYGLVSELPELVTRWLNGGGTGKCMPEAFRQNMEAIRSLENERPGIVKFLISKFGIYNFGRYPESLLVKQYDEYENQELPYGIALFAEDDHNGFLFENKDELDEMAKELRGRYAIRFMEANGKKELLRLFTRLRLKYSRSHKISFAIVGSHGNKEVLTLGNVDNPGDREISMEDIVDYGKRKYKLFGDNATIILLACRSGQSKSVGGAISKVLDTTVIAPSFDAGLDSIKPIIDGEYLKFKVRYTHEARATRFTPKKTRKENSI